MVHYPVCPMDCPLQSKYVLVNHQDDSNMDHIKSFIAEILISKTQFCVLLTDRAHRALKYEKYELWKQSTVMEVNCSLLCTLVLCIRQMHDSTALPTIYIVESNAL